MKNVTLTVKYLSPDDVSIQTIFNYLCQGTMDNGCLVESYHNEFERIEIPDLRGK